MANFSHCPPPIFEFDECDSRGECNTYPPAVELFNQGADPTDIYFVRSGIVKLTRSEANGEAILLDLRFQGSLVGSAAAISEKPHPFAATTVTSCTLTRWSSGKFLKLIATNTSVAIRVRRTLSDEVLDHVARISQLTCLPARQRLEQLLATFCERAHPPDGRQQRISRLQLPLKHYEIAHLLSITPTYLCRLLNTLEKENVIARSKGWIIVKEPGGEDR